ncbi:type II toxin-antitoxin system Phd/YefM family antitoxin [Tyzzerella sp. OttesenSCG-928-J15]|nr:type II toxin-antitoxin system Phd/YefM family antitoxin [Tyzzerella sp. OttesenSCG-928-J15]
MPTIKPSSELRNNYNEISDICHKSMEPVFITRNGKGDLAVMSIEFYEKITNHLGINKFFDDEAKGKNTKGV